MERGTLWLLLPLLLLLLPSADAGFTPSDRADSSPLRPRQLERKRPCGMPQIFEKGAAEGGSLFTAAAAQAFSRWQHV